MLQTRTISSLWQHKMSQTRTNPPSPTSSGLRSPILTILLPYLILHSYLAPNLMLNHSLVCQDFPLLQIFPPHALSSLAILDIPWCAGDSLLDGFGILNSIVSTCRLIICVTMSPFLYNHFFCFFWLVSTMTVFFFTAIVATTTFVSVYGLMLELHLFWTSNLVLNWYIFLFLICIWAF